MKKFILALFLAIVIVSDANAQSTLALQEKCAVGAKNGFLNTLTRMVVRGGVLPPKTDRLLVGIRIALKATTIENVKMFHKDNLEFFAKGQR